MNYICVLQSRVQEAYRATGGNFNWVSNCIEATPFSGCLLWVFGKPLFIFWWFLMCYMFWRNHSNDSHSLWSFVLQYLYQVMHYDKQVVPYLQKEHHWGPAYRGQGKTTNNITEEQLIEVRQVRSLTLSRL